MERGPPFLVLDGPVRPVIKEKLRYLGSPVVARRVEGYPLVLGPGVHDDARLVQQELDNLLMPLLHRQVQGAPVVLVLQDVVNPLLQQELGNRGVTLKRRQVEAVAAAVNGLVDLRPPRDKEPRYLVVAVLAGHVERCPLFSVLCRNVCPTLEKVRGHLDPPLEDGVVQGGASIVGPHVRVHPTALLREEEGNDLEVALLGGQVEGCPAVPVPGGHQLPAVSRGDDVFHALEVAMEGGCVDSVASCLAGQGEVGLVVADHLDDLGVALLRSKDDGCPTVFILDVDIDLVLEENLGDVHETFKGSQVERRSANLYGVVGVRPVLYEALGYLGVTVVAGEVEGCPALVVLDADKLV